MSETDYAELARKAAESEDEGKHVPFTERPRFGSKQARVEFALAKYHGLGADNGWPIVDIADYLNVEPRTVERYVFESELAAEVDEQIAAAEAHTRLRVSQQLLGDLEEFDELEAELSQETRPAVTSHRVETVEAPLSIEAGTTRITTDEPHRITVAIPDNYTEVTEIEALKDVWAEKRKITTQLRQLLGLDAPERIESEHREINHDLKIWEIDASAVSTEASTANTPVADVDEGDEEG